MNIFYKEASVARFSPSLNALRGVAACVVFCQHLTIHVVRANYDLNHDGTPFNGPAAVTFFFVLSGLVLGISLARSPLTNNYILYMTRRLFRIMPLMIVTVTIGGLYYIYVEPHMPVPSVPPEVGPLTPLKFLAAYIGYSQKPNLPIWSIYVELIASALLPFLVASGRSKKLTLALGAALLIFSSFQIGLKHDWNVFMIDFFMGLSVLWWGRAFAERVMRLDPRLFWLLVAVLVGIFYLAGEIIHFEWHDPLCNFIKTAAITPFIAIVFFCPQRFVMFNSRPFRFLGDVSYSLYLTHWVIASFAVNVAVMLMPSLFVAPTPVSVAAMVLAMIAVVLPVCLVVSGLSYQYIEQPGQALGRLAVAALQRRLARPEQRPFG